ncbi:hypothetical protein ACFSWE_07330 [Leucobacter albus]|uniref:Sigma-like protein n=1 Tax=Leucobacter albus TaxID=272210 RepID=A0ABW3TIW5_9MICO
MKDDTRRSDQTAHTGSTPASDTTGSTHASNATGASPNGTIDEPIMDGATDTQPSDADPRKGQSDPALVRHPEKDDKTTSPYNL